MRAALLAASLAVLTACTGGGQDAASYVPPQLVSEPEDGVRFSGYGRFGWVKGR